MKKTLSLLSVLLLLVSCTMEIDQQFGSRAGVPGGKTVFQAAVEGCTAADSTPGTKVYADENMKVLWNEGDQISIFNLTTLNTQWAFTGEDGDTAGGFEEVQSGGFFTGNPLNYVYAAYPYSKSNKISNEGVLTMILPAEQNYMEKSFGIGANTMVAITDGSFLAFKNVGGYLSLRLYGDNVSVSRITIKGNNGEKIAGKAFITMPLGGTPSISMDETATDEVSVVCNPAVKIGTDANNYTDFWFVIPPVYFSLGFTIIVTDDKGGVFERTTSKALTINRNTLEWMAALEVVPDYTNANVPFEDANFKAYCVENFDNNEDGEISFSEAGVVTSISCDRRSIQSLSGIEYFTNLTELHCNDNQLTSLNVSLNTALTNLECRSNQLTSLEVSHNTSLTSLNCFSNQLSSLDVSSNTALLYLHCGDNQLTSLNIANNTALQTLGCDINQFTRLDVSHNTALTALSCDSNQLANLDVSHNAALTALRCCSNSLTRLDVSFNTALEFLECAYNQLTSLDVSHNTSLNYLKCSPMAELQYLYVANGQTIPNVTENRSTDFIPAKTEIVVSTGDNVIFADANFKAYCVENFDLDGDGEISIVEANWVTDISINTENIISLQGIECFKNLQRLRCTPDYTKALSLSLLNDDNEFVVGLLTALDISNNLSLESLICTGNQLSSLDLSSNLLLKNLDCGYNRLTTISTEKNTLLESLICQANQLTEINIGTSSELTVLKCSYNKITNLDVTNNAALEELDCRFNQLIGLDISKNTTLLNLACSNNPLMNLDISKNATLLNLECSNNQLMSLDITKNTLLSHLACSGNQLEILNVSNNTDLTLLCCQANKLSNIDISNNALLDTLTCFNNQLQSLDVSNNIALSMLYVNSNQLTSLDVSHNTALTSLNCCSNQLTSLDVSNNTSLNYLDCSPMAELQFLYVANGQTIPNVTENRNTNLIPAATEIVVNTGNIVLFEDVNFKAYCVENFDKDGDGEISVSEALLVTSINCSGKDIQSLSGIEYFTNLTELQCNDNQLTSLDVSHNTALTYLNCSSNQLTSLDVSNNTGLSYLDCSYNQLTSLDVSQLVYLHDLDCRSNPMLTELWLNRKQTDVYVGMLIILYHDSSITTIKYKD